MCVVCFVMFSVCEWEVLDGIVCGGSNKVIVCVFGLLLCIVEMYCVNVFDKL